MFLDWALAATNCDVPTKIFDGGGRLYSTTALDNIGRAVANALLKVNETKNKFLLMHGAVLNQKQPLEYG